jgi:2-oxoglutarate ferredoxin oxidoreductase subunit delta
MADKTVKLKIDAEKCKGCLLCVDICPKKVLVLSDKVNKRGLRYVIVKYPEKCTGCALCALMCPDCSITIK